LLLCIVLSVDAAPFTLTGYWGQDGGGDEPTLINTCNDPSWDILIISFIDVFGSNQPIHLDLSDHCSDTFPGSRLLHCPAVGDDITQCQSMGKKILLSLGGADGSYGFTSTADAQSVAKVIWDMFLGGNSTTRPFDSGIIDGVDLDIESNDPKYYADFITTLRGLYSTDKSRTYYITGAPQCVYPDASLGPDSSTLHNTALSHAWFDWVNIQFYNNDCGVNKYPRVDFNYVTWAKNLPVDNPNPSVKIVIGLIASSQAGGGYVPASTVASIIQTYNQSAQLAGVMMWDVGSAIKNSNYQKQIKAVLHSINSQNHILHTERETEEME